MKTMTCRQLAGACDLQFHADTWEEMAKQSQNHGAEMAAKKDFPHLKAMNDMMKAISDPNEMQKWMDEKRRQFDLLPDDK
jgi:hypothetical protein